MTTTLKVCMRVCVCVLICLFFLLARSLFNLEPQLFLVCFDIAATVLMASIFFCAHKVKCELACEWQRTRQSAKQFNGVESG